VLVPDVRLEDEDVVRDELTALLEVAEVLFDCAKIDDEANKVNNPQITVGRSMAKPAFMFGTNRNEAADTKWVITR
jgi:hypothetical protein